MLTANTRNPNNDTTTVHEDIILDLGACVRVLKEEHGVEKVGKELRAMMPWLNPVEM